MPVSDYMISAISGCWGPPPSAKLPAGLLSANLRHLQTSRAGEKIPRPCDFATMPTKVYGGPSMPNRASVVAAQPEFTVVEATKRVRQQVAFPRPKRATMAPKGPGVSASRTRQQELRDNTTWVAGPGGRGGKKVVMSQRTDRTMPGSGFQQIQPTRPRMPPRRQADWSIEIRSDWELKQTVNLTAISKTMLEQDRVTMEDVAWRGKPFIYDKRADLSTPRVKNILPPGLPKSLVAANDEYFEEKSMLSTQCSTLHDETWWPIIQKSQNDHKNARQVIASNEIVSILMTACHSRFSWYLRANIVDGVLIFEKDYGSAVEKIFMDESIRDFNPTEEPNYDSFCNEVAHINDKFMSKVLRPNKTSENFGSNKIELDEIEYTKQKPTKLYRYTTTKMPPIRAGNPDFVVNYRSEIDGQLPNASGTSGLVLTRALLEKPGKSKKSWHVVGEASGALLTGELCHHDSILNRWMTSSYLAGCDSLKLGFISKNAQIAGSHDLISVSSIQPQSQIGMKCSHRWGVLRLLLEAIFKLEIQNGSILLLKEPNAQSLRIYSVPEEESAQEI
eukprot:GHVP01066869.1.p1 GENE.GHVP01066869.1~~GHVP01066869.1.p1  ORF type:complete len:561 (+),score=96.99 GHVP01066869.1:22-1704(+)